MNYSDTEKIAAVFFDVGCVKADNIDDADILVLNTCSVRQRAEDKVLGLCRKVRNLKLRRSGLMVILTGCMAQRLNRNGSNKEDWKYKKELKRKLHWVDHFLDIGDLTGLYKILSGTEKVVDDIDTEQSYSSEVSGFVPITKGCDNFCTYCIVPYTRGKEVSVGLNRVYSKVLRLVGEGTKLITLLGQNVNSWKGEIDGCEAGFPELLAKIADIEGEFWVTFLTAHPKDFSSELIDVMSRKNKVCLYVNLPFQSGSNRILRRMNRKYTRSQYLNKIEEILDKIPNVRVSTDVIVGFPCESSKDFERSLNLLKTEYFGMAYVSEFSSRKGTPAALLEDNIPHKLKKQRKKQLIEVMGEIMKKRNSRMIGKMIRVLVMAYSVGKTIDLRDVDIVNPERCSLGEFVDAKVIGASAGGLKVKVIV